VPALKNDRAGVGARAPTGNLGERGYFFAFSAAHRFFCASLMALRAAAESFRLGFGSMSLARAYAGIRFDGRGLGHGVKSSQNGGALGKRTGTSAVDAPAGDLERGGPGVLA
jgi:hypothetical protein